MADAQYKSNGSERTPLLQRSQSTTEHDQSTSPSRPDTIIDWDHEDPENPRLWSHRQKMANVFIIAAMALLSPLASSMFTPGISEIAKSLHTPSDTIVGATTGFVILLGVGPLILAPLSETFGRRAIYLISFTIFSLLQIPTALSPNVETLLTCRTIAGFFGSVGIANGGGTINDMFIPSERAGVFGWYLLGPLLGPTLGPLFGGFIVEFAGWRAIFWILTGICSFNTILGFIFLRESFAPAILHARCKKLSAKTGDKYYFVGQDMRPLSLRLMHSMKRPLKILFTQPIIIIIGVYQSVMFSSMYSLFTNMETMFSNAPYNFNKLQIGALYIAPGSGFLLAVWFIVPRIDTVYNILTERNDGVAKPEFRLPITNIGAVLLPAVLISFGWCVEKQVHWLPTILITVFFGLGNICIMNTVQNYYIDAFSMYAASAIAAGTLFRSLVGGVIPLFAPQLFRELGYGWGWTVFGLVAFVFVPLPMLLMRYGEILRKKFAVEL